MKFSARRSRAAIELWQTCGINYGSKRGSHEVAGGDQVEGWLLGTTLVGVVRSGQEAEH